MTVHSWKTKNYPALLKSELNNERTEWTCLEIKIPFSLPFCNFSSFFSHVTFVSAMWLLLQPCDFVTLHLLNLCTNNVRLFVHHCPCFCYPLFLRIKKIKREQRGLFFCATNFWRISQLVIAGAWCGEDVRRGEARLRANRDQLDKVALVYWRALAS